MPVHYGPPESPDNKAIRELRDEVKDLNRTIKKSIKVSERLTNILILVAVLQLTIAFFQFIASLIGPVEYWVAILVELTVAGMVLYILKSVSRSLGFRK